MLSCQVFACSVYYRARSVHTQNILSCEICAHAEFLCTDRLYVVLSVRSVPKCVSAISRQSIPLYMCVCVYKTRICGANGARFHPIFPTISLLFSVALSSSSSFSSSSPPFPTACLSLLFYTASLSISHFSSLVLTSASAYNLRVVYVSIIFLYCNIERHVLHA